MIRRFESNELNFEFVDSKFISLLKLHPWHWNDGLRSDNLSHTKLHKGDFIAAGDVLAERELEWDFWHLGDDFDILSIIEPSLSDLMLFVLRRIRSRSE